jgi:hypothetical protein
VLLISWTFRITEPNRKLGLIVCMISFGVALTSSGELRFNLLGFIIQAAAVVFEASRLVMIEILLHGMKMDPLVSLHYYAPVCALINLTILPFTEGLAPFYQLARLGPLVIISNAAVAFFLNVAAVFLVGVTSGLVLTLAGVLKVRLIRIHTCVMLISHVAHRIFSSSWAPSSSSAPRFRHCKSSVCASLSCINNIPLIFSLNRLLNRTGRPRPVPDHRRKIDTTRSVVIDYRCGIKAERT